MTQGDGDAIVERFRQAAMGMTDWTDALSGIADATCARIGQLVAADHRGHLAFNFLSGCSPDEEEAYFLAGGPDPAVNPRTRSIFAATPFRCVVERDFITPAAAARLPIYRQLFRQCDVPFSAQTRIDFSPDLRVSLCLQRPGSSGEADADQVRFIDALSPAIGSAVQTAIALGTMQHGTLVQTAEHLSGAAILLGADRQIVSLSPAAEALLHAGTHIVQHRGRLRLRCAKAAAVLDVTVSSIIAGAAALHRAVPVLLPAIGDGPPLTADLCPLPARRAGPLSRARVLLAIRLPNTGTVDEAALIAAFSLTRSEAAVAILLTRGCDLRSIADQRGTALATVRTQLKSLFEKTGCRRQAELVVILRPYC